MSSETIAAIATPRGVGGISIIRISGADSLDIAKKITKKESLNDRVATLCNIYDEKGSLIDISIVIYFKSPKSFTGEDVVEIQTHGGTVVSDMVLESTLKNGARVSNPGEFTKRAYLNGKIDLSQAEAISKLIEAKSVDAAKMLLKTLRGELSKLVESIRGELVNILAYIEVSIDYAEEDLPPNQLLEIRKKLSKTTDKLDATLRASESRSGMLDGFKLAIIGKPNAGKSSLLNRLLRYERAIVSDIAGTTRDTIEESLKIGTHLVKIIDTAGIRDAKDEIEKIGIERSKAALLESDIILCVFDGSQPLDEHDQKILELIGEHKEQKIFLALINKSDLPKKIDEHRVPIENRLFISCSHEIDILISKLQELLDANCDYDEVILSSKRQIESIRAANTLIKSASTRLEGGELELFSFEIREALMEISKITRPFEYGELLDTIFGEFCLGK